MAGLVIAAADAIVSVDDFVSVDEDGDIVIDVLANDSGGGTILSHSSPTFGGLVLLPNDTFFYFPTRNYNGPDNFTYTIEGPDGATDTATVSITVNPVNDGPVARDDQFSVDENAAATNFFVLGNDGDAEGDAVSVTGNTDPANGSLADNGNGSFSYTPAPGFSGQDSFTYTVSDTSGATDTATVTITVVAAGTRPVPMDDEAVTAPGTQITIPVLENDTPGIEELSILSVFGRTNGTVEISADRTAIIYTPDDGFTGYETLSYRVSDDFLVPTTRVLIHVKPANPDPDRILIATLDPADGFVIQGEEDSDRLGESVSRAGDINGDGIGDFIVAAPSADLYGQGSGTAYVIFGTRDGFGVLQEGRRVLELDELNAAHGFRIHRNAFDLVGTSVSAAGDVNGDGFDDIIIGISDRQDDGNGYGEAYVLFGKEDGFGAVVDLEILSPDDGFLIVGSMRGGSGNDSNGGSDSRDAVIGDVNGDGIDDIIVSSPGSFYGGGNSDGRAYVIFGTRDGFGDVLDGRRVLDVDSLSTEQGFRLSGGNDGGFFGDRAGWSVSGAGDVNGDGFTDFLVGSRNDEAYLIFGSDQAFAPEIDLRAIDTMTGVILRGMHLSDAGHSVARVGDINGDGLDDFAVGARRGDTATMDLGATYVVFGRTTDFGEEIAGQHILELPTLSEEDGFIIRGDSKYDQAGFVVAHAGDFNGDGIDDMIVGAPYGDDGAPDAGEAYIIYGSTDGFGTLVGEQRILDLSKLTPETGLVIQGDQEERAAGFGVASAGDINDDGFDDVIVGGPSRDFGRIRDDGPGEAYVIFGFGVGPPNGPPVAAADRAETAVGASVIIDVLANDSDPESAPLTVTGASDPAGGSVVVNQDGTVTYTPDAGFRGQDSFTYTVSDGNGGSDTASVSIQVGPPPIRIVAGDGAVISIGGNGDVFGTNFDGGAAGRQDITFVPPPAGAQQAISLVPQGDAAPPLALDGDANDFDLDGSFGRGGDVLRFAGAAGGYTIAIQGVAAEISDGFSSYALPIGTAGLVLVFDDGARTLAFDTGSGEVMLGSQTVTATPAQITAPDDGTQIPDIGNPATVSRAVLFENAQALLGGTFDVFGTNDGAETVGYVSGELALDGSFARGGDEVSFEGSAATYSAYLSGTSLILLTPEGEVAAPVGVAGLTLDFAGDERTLAFDAGAGQVMIGDQAITATTAGAAQALMAEGFA